jgi:hypothetical protein
MYQFYPKTLYKINDFDSIRVVDSTLSTRISNFINSFRGLGLRPYIVKDGERPDIVSNKLYGTPKYDYALLLVNNISSIYDEWPRDSVALNRYVVEKYGNLSFAINTIGFWYTGNNLQVSEQYWLSLNDPQKYRETFYQYEVRQNDTKSRINVIDLIYIIQFESGLQEILNT